MIRVFVLIILLGVYACKGPEEKKMDAGEIVDRSINVSGGERYKNSKISFDFRDYRYISEYREGSKVLMRVKDTASVQIKDIRYPDKFERFIGDSLVTVPDTSAVKYANSINSVHYFAYLPYGLNDPAVNKELLGETKIGDSEYYKVRVTFDQQGGGDDYEDVYLYWFNKATFEPDYLAYEFHVDGGGMRFREAYNERKVEGIRFVDYKNYEYTGSAPFVEIDSLFQNGKLRLLSKIELSNIEVIPGNYN